MTGPGTVCLSAVFLPPRLRSKGGGFFRLFNKRTSSRLLPKEATFPWGRLRPLSVFKAFIKLSGETVGME